MTKQISDLPAEVNANASDYVPFRDVSASSDKKTTVAGLAAGVAAGFSDGAISGSAINVNYAVHSATFDNLTVGSGALVARYANVGKVIRGYGSLTFAAGTVMGTSPKISLPIPASSNVKDYQYLGKATYFWTSGGRIFSGYLYKTPSVQKADFEVEKVVSAPAYVENSGGITPSVPFNWGSGSTIYWQFEYEAA